MARVERAIRLGQRCRRLALFLWAAVLLVGLVVAIVLTAPATVP
jgi:hypothetical protein